MRAAWTMEHLIYEGSILLGMAIDTTTTLTYSSAANSYLAFCKLHHLPVCCEYTDIFPFSSFIIYSLNYFPDIFSIYLFKDTI